jgi:hypothetical protein
MMQGGRAIRRKVVEAGRRKLFDSMPSECAPRRSAGVGPSLQVPDQPRSTARRGTIRGASVGTEHVSGCSSLEPIQQLGVSGRVARPAIGVVALERPLGARSSRVSVRFHVE